LVDQQIDLIARSRKKLRFARSMWRIWLRIPQPIIVLGAQGARSSGCRAALPPPATGEDQGKFAV